MKTTQELVPVVLDLFKAEVTPFKGSPATAENIERAALLIGGYIMRLQILDLSLSETDARNLLKQVYQSI